jgi:hypothetical protein
MHTVVSDLTVMIPGMILVPKQACITFNLVLVLGKGSHVHVRSTFFPHIYICRGEQTLQHCNFTYILYTGIF